MKLSNVQIALIEAALNYDDRESQLGDNMSNLTGFQAADICAKFGIKFQSQKAIYDKVNLGNDPILLDLFRNEDLEERMDLMHDCGEDKELGIKFTTVANGPFRKVKPTQANFNKVYGHQILWISNHAINTYFDMKESESKSDIDLIDIEIKKLEEKKTKLLKIKELESEIEALKAEL